MRAIYNEKQFKAQLDMFGNDPAEVTVDVLYFKAIESIDRKIRKDKKSTQSLISNNNFYSEYFALSYDVEDAKKAKKNFQDKSAEVKSGHYDQEVKKMVLDEMIRLNEKLPKQEQLLIADIEEVAKSYLGK